MAAFLAEYNVPADRLTLEITENALVDATPMALDGLHALARLGVRLSIDDFGTGYSSLAYLKNLPVSEVKIDRCFVRDMRNDERDRSIVAAVVDMAQALGLSVVAEGVEDGATAEALTVAGVDVLQGYALCRPVPAPEVQRWVNDNSR